MKRTGCYLQTNIPLLDDHMGGKESQLLCTVSKGVKQEPQSRASVERYSPFGQLMGDFLASVSCGPWVRPLSGKSSQHPGILQKHFQTSHFPLEKTSNCLCLFMSPAHLGSSGEISSTEGMKNWATTLLHRKKTNSGQSAEC